MKLLHKTLAATAAALWLATPALADINIGVTLSLTGPASGLGIPVGNQFKLFPKEIAGEKINLIMLDDASDPGKGVANARRFVTEDKVDILFGGSITVVSAAVAPVALKSKTPQLSIAPVGVPPDQEALGVPVAAGCQRDGLPDHRAHEEERRQDHRLPRLHRCLRRAVVEGDDEGAEAAGIKLGAVERFARTDTSATPQALKLVSSNPDAILVVASGSGAAMPHKALIERGYKGKIYQTHAAATPDLVRIGGKDVEGSFVVSGPAVVAEQLPAEHPSKAAAVDFVTKYEAAYGKGTRSQFGAHAYDAQIVMEKVLPVALKKARPGTPEFRAALRDGIETMGRTIFSHGVMNCGHGPITGATPMRPACC